MSPNTLNDTAESSSKVTFEAPGIQISRREREVHGMAGWIMGISGGRITNESQANIALMAGAVILCVISLMIAVSSLDRTSSSGDNNINAELVGSPNDPGLQGS